MAKWGKCDFRELERLGKRLEQLSAVDFDAFCRQMANELAGRLLRKVVKRTPVGVKPSVDDPILGKYWSGYQGGSLRDAWTVLPIEKNGDSYTIIVINNLEYASYVEYGHRQTPGRFVPAIGVRLKRAWVPGRYMMTISAQELERQAPKILEKRLYEFLKGCFDAK